MGWKRSALAAARRTRLLDALAAGFGRGRLTVLAYHRIADAADPGLAGYRGNVSATPAEFAAHLDLVVRRHRVVALDDVLHWLDGGPALPDRPALITFDDGYRDNLDAAAPLLAERGLPATLFLTTGPTDGGPALFWDRAAAVFGSAPPSGSADLPGLGACGWGSPEARDRIADRFVRAHKRLPPPERDTALERAAASLGVESVERIDGLYLDWDGVRALEGWSIGAHTVTHPVLTSVPQRVAEEEIAVSRRRVEEETGHSAAVLAYPNGMRDDVDAAVRRAARAAGIVLAFTLLPGPSRASEVRGDPMAVRRSCITHDMSALHVEAALRGAERVAGVLR